jgi:hypothetical protein
MLRAFSARRMLFYFDVYYYEGNNILVLYPVAVQSLVENLRSGSVQVAAQNRSRPKWTPRITGFRK